MKDNSLIEKVEELLNESTEGPWREHRSGHYMSKLNEEILSIPKNKTVLMLTHGSEYDRQLVIFIKNNLQKILTKIKNLEMAAENLLNTSEDLGLMGFGRDQLEMALKQLRELD